MATNCISQQNATSGRGQTNYRMEGESPTAVRKNYVTVLAIYDKKSPPPNKEITPTTEQTNNRQPQIISPTVIPIRSQIDEPNKHSSKHSSTKDISTNTVVVAESDGDASRGRNRNTQSISFDEPIFERSTDKFSRSDARKSKISQSFLEAKDRIEQEMEDAEHYSQGFDKAHKFYRIVLSDDGVDVPIGVEISAIPDPTRPSHLLAVEVIRIEENGRISQDGRMRVGDQIVEINGLPCCEMSYARARLHLRELASISEPTIAFQRQLKRQKMAEESSDNMLQSQAHILRPVITPLQQANTSKIGLLKNVRIKKSPTGFGFGFAGRLNANGEHMYYVTSIKAHGPSDKLLNLADRILKIDDHDISNDDQTELSSILKSKAVGESVLFVISRSTALAAISSINSKEQQKQFASELISAASRNENMEESGVDSLLEQALHLQDFVDSSRECLIQLDIPLSDSPSAGLGISLKAQRSYVDGLSTDSGIYIRSILHGSTAFRDGRLRVNDRLAAIEDCNLLKFELNGEALDTFMRCLSAMPSDSPSIRLFIIRRLDKDESGGGSLQSTPTAAADPLLALKARMFDGSASKLQQRHASDSELSQISSVIDPDTFTRDAAIRKSISEKRPLGMHTDPSHLETYQRIVHRRQTSAPALATRKAKLSRQAPARHSFGDKLTSNTNKNCVDSEQQLRMKSKQSVKMDVDIEEGKENCQIRARPQTVYGGFLPTFTPSAMPTNSPKLSVGNVNTDRKPGASSFKHKKKSLLTDFFNGLTFGGSGAAKKNGNFVVTDDVRCNKENQFQLDSSSASAVNSSPKRRSKSFISRNTSSPFDDRNKRAKELLFDASTNNGNGTMGAANSRISTSQSHQDFNGFTTVDRGNYDHHYLPTANQFDTMRNLMNEKSERRKSFGNGILKFFKGSSSSPKEKWRRSPTAEFYYNHHMPVLPGWDSVGGDFDAQQHRLWLEECWARGAGQFPATMGHGEHQKQQQHFLFPPPYCFYNFNGSGGAAFYPPTSNQQQQQMFYHHQRGYSSYEPLSQKHREKHRSSNNCHRLPPNTTNTLINTQPPQLHYIQIPTTTTNNNIEHHLTASYDYDCCFTPTDSQRQFQQHNYSWGGATPRHPLPHSAQHPTSSKVASKKGSANSANPQEIHFVEINNDYGQQQQHHPQLVVHGGQQHQQPHLTCTRLSMTESEKRRSQSDREHSNFQRTPTKDAATGQFREQRCEKPVLQSVQVPKSGHIDSMPPKEAPIRPTTITIGSTSGSQNRKPQHRSQEHQQQSTMSRQRTTMEHPIQVQHHRESSPIASTWSKHQQQQYHQNQHGKSGQHAQKRQQLTAAVILPSSTSFPPTPTAPTTMAGENTVRRQKSHQRQQSIPSFPYEMGATTTTRIPVEMVRSFDCSHHSERSNNNDSVDSSPSKYFGQPLQPHEFPASTASTAKTSKLNSNNNQHRPTTAQVQQKLLRRSIPTAVFYDDCEPPV